jgi:carbon monoxide dehydrogenase subunit G
MGRSVVRCPRRSAALGVGGAAMILAGVVMVRRRFRTEPPRKPGRFEESVEIARPPGEVFAFVADPRNDANWTPQIEEMRKTSEGPMGVGSTCEVVVGLMGRRFEISGEIIEYDEPSRKVRLRNSSGPPRLEALRSVEAVPNGARFTVKAEIRTDGFFWLLPDPLFGRLLRRPGKQTLANLKDFLEARG